MTAERRSYDPTLAYWHPCPRCGANPGIRCMDAREQQTGPGRRFLSWFHKPREAAAYAESQRRDAAQETA